MANKLELTWYGKDEPIRVEPRLLIENAELSNTAADPGTENMLIHGDNLLALKALETRFAGQVKCIYIDPPYNVDYEGEAGKIKNDNMSDSIFLKFLSDAFENASEYLRPGSSFYIWHADSQGMIFRQAVSEKYGNNDIKI